jgi:hypothetical protein
LGTITKTTIDNNNTEYYENGITKLLKTLLDTTNKEIDNLNNTNYSKIKDVTLLMKENLTKNFSPTINNNYWEVEMRTISPLITNLYSMINSSNFKITKAIGENLDNARHSLIFGEKTTFKLMAVSLDIVKNEILGEGISETFDTLVEIETWLKNSGTDITDLEEQIANEAKIRAAADSDL